MRRRSVLFWLSFGLYKAGEALNVDALDRLAAATYNRGRSSAPPGYATKPSTPVPARSMSQASYLTAHAMPMAAPPAHVFTEPDAGEPGEADLRRRARQGRPPSRWLRNLEADELRTWLAGVSPPFTGVSGMTVWTHLTRDHYFDAEKIAGLTPDEQTKLHNAAHYGY